MYQRLQSGSEALTLYSVRGLDLLIFIVLVSLAAPTALLAAETVISKLAGFSKARVVHAGVLGVLLGLVLWQALQNSAVLALVALVITAIAVALLYLRSELIRNFALMLAVATPVVIVLFAASYPIRYEVLPGERAMAAQQADSQPPVVMVVLDELSLALLQDERDGIDRRMIPSLGRIADQTTWYPNTLAVGDETLAALPSIMTGEDADFSEEKTPPGLPSYPDNVCSITAKAGYRVRAIEVVTDLCQRKSGFGTRMADLLRLGVNPKSVSLAEEANLPEDSEESSDELTPGRVLERVVDRVAERYPPIPAAWDIHRPDYVRSFTDGLDLAPGGFNFLHVLLPHAPYQFTDQGRGYPSLVLEDGDTAKALENPENLPESRKHMQQALAQTIYTFGLIEAMIEKMKAEGVWDESMFVLTADHGASFALDAPRRTLIEANEGWMLPVPLFIKYPGQEKGRIDDRFATSRDITPTVLDVLGLDPSAAATGHSLLDPPVSAPERLAVTSQATGALEVEPGAVDRDRRAATRMKADAFAGGDLFALGGHRGLLGTGVRGNPDLKQLEANFTSGGPEVMADPAAPFVPSYLQADLPEVNGDPGPIAVTVNGRIVATTRAWRRNGTWMTGVNVPDDSFRKGSNRIALYAIAG